jgi:hypothetical protein
MALSDLRKRAEKSLGLPSLETLTKLGDKIPDKESLELYCKLIASMPDKETMRELNKFAAAAQKLSVSAPDLGQVIQLFTLVKELDFAQLNEVLDKLLNLIKTAPKEVTEFLGGLNKE